MNLSSLILIFTQGFMMAIYLALYLRLKRDHKRTSWQQALLVLLLLCALFVSHIIFSLVSIVIALCYIRMLKAQDNDMEEGKPATPNSSLDVVMQMLDVAIPQFCLTERHFTNPDLTVIELSRAVGSNRTYVARWFSERGTNFSTYINGLRLDYAEELLRHSTKSANEISIAAGFGTLHTFTRVFKARYGCTPEQYRHQLTARPDNP